MKTVYKYKVPFVGDFERDGAGIPFQPPFKMALPSSAVLLTSALQHGHLCIWCLVDIDEPVELRRFKLFATGEPIKVPIVRYVGTGFFKDGKLVYHLFEIGDSDNA